MTDRWPRPDSRDDGEPIGALNKDHVDSILERLREHRSTQSRHVEGAVLGQGGMGIVLEVRDADLRRPLALKRLHPKRVANTDSDVRRHYLARFLQEAQVTGQLAHPGIPPVHELSIDELGPFFTMPVIRGQNLDEVFAKARNGSDGWSLARALGVLLKVCEAMAFAHAKRVVHRDLKPDNVRIGRFGEVYVMDWGLARVLGREEMDLVRWSKTGTLSSVHTDREDSDGDANAVLQTLDGDVLGTPFYMAPEQARGELAQVGPRTDVYAVGGLLYLLLTGRAPYEPEEGRISQRTVLGLVLHGPPARVATVSPTADADLVAICEKAMAREADARYASMEDLASDIEAWIDRRPIRASAPSVRHALRLYYERHRAAVATAAFALLTLALAGTWFVIRVTRERDEKENALVHAQRRGDSMAASALLVRESELWPATLGMVAEMEAWLSQVADLESRLSAYRVDAGSVSHASDAQREISALVSGAEALLRARPAVESRLVLAGNLERISIGDELTAWSIAIADIAANPAYGGLTIEAQLGLVPLGKNPESGLWEFWHVATGRRPTPAATHSEDGITLVLLAGAEFTMGQRPQETTKHAIEAAQQAVVAPFFVSKYEVTQAQWTRVMGTAPSRCRPGVHEGPEETLRNPVESISWLECVVFCRRSALHLPTTAQWEYAARARSDLTFVYGDEFTALELHENVRDRSWKSRDPAQDAAWDDRYVFSAPVGSFGANTWGLHDVLGNVSEWCQDEFANDGPVSRGWPENGTRAFRGANYWLHPSNARPAFVQWDGPGGRNHTRGLRPIALLRGL